MLAYLLQGFVLGATAAAQPGPFQAFLLSLIAREGWRRALPASLAPLISDGPILLVVLLVLTRLPAEVLAGLQAAGGLFLLYLAWNAWQSLRQTTHRSNTLGESTTEGPLTANVAKAVVMNLLSPSPYIFWATVAGPILIEAWRLSPLYGLSFLLAFYLALIGGLTLFILIFAGAGKIEPRVNVALGVISVMGLLVFGMYQLVVGIKSIDAMLS